MIYVTGDTHGLVKLGYRSRDGVSQRLSKYNLHEKNIPMLTSGDFGGIWEYANRYDSDRV